MLGLLKYIKKKDWLLMLIGLALIVVQVWLELKMPDYTAKLTTIVNSQETSMSTVWKNGGLMLACAGGSLVSAIICSILISRVASSFSRTIREKMFNTIVDFADAEIKDFSVPSLITRTTNDVMQVQMFMAMGIQLLFKAPIMAIWAIFKISATNVQWTSAVLISVLLIAFCVGILIFVCFPRFKRIQKLTDDINNVTRENISGIRVVRAFNAEEYQENKFENVNKQIASNQLITSRTMSLMNPVMTVVMNGLTLAIYWIGAILINDIAFGSDPGVAINERITLLGDMAAFTQYAMQVIMSFMMLIMIFIILPRTMVSGNRILEVLKTKPSINSGKENGECLGQIEFKNVSFVYPDGDENEKVLSDISFRVNKGETLAIIGATGSAKTTLINLIPRFYDATEGEVIVDGINVKDYDIDALRKKISIASQKAVMFKGSVKDNIAYGSLDVDNDKIYNVIEISQADFIMELDNKLEAEVAQGGTNFSGGQKQRISIARAIYKDSKIIIFDDTFSALDYKTDMLIRKSIKDKLDDRTIIIVAQRIGTIKDADKILVLDEGKIVGEGRHQELLINCQIYREIALSQLSKEEL